MANQLITVKEVARRALPRLMENLVFPSLIYKNYSEEFQPGKGARVQVKKPVVLTAADFDAEGGTVPANVQESSVDVVLDKLATVDVEFGAVESATDIDSLERLFIIPAAQALAEKINADGMDLFMQVSNVIGTPGTTPSTLEALAGAARVLNENKAPLTERYGVWDPAANAAFQQLPALVNAEKSGSTRALREGAIGRVFGVDHYMAQGVKNVSSPGLAAGGTGADGLKLKSAVTDARELVLESNASSGGTLSGGVKKGDILLVNGSSLLITQDSTASANQITVTVAGAVTLPAGCAVRAVCGGAQNLVFHKNAFAFVTRPLSAPGGVESYTTSFNGISLRVCRGYDMKYKKDMLSMDVLYGYKAVYPQLAVRVLG